MYTFCYCKALNLPETKQKNTSLYRLNNSKASVISSNRQEKILILIPYLDCKHSSILISHQTFSVIECIEFILTVRNRIKPSPICILKIFCNFDKVLCFVCLINCKGPKNALSLI